MRIFLVGYMGCGKSRWGKRIADHYGIRFIDLDVLIEEREKASISELFEKYGEAGFREKERQALESIATEDNVIVATGGGAPCFNNNMERINSMGVSLYIEAHPELLRDRITDSEPERPLVRNLSQDELLNYIKRHLQTRLPFYQQANYRLISGNLELDDFIQVIDPILNC